MPRAERLAVLGLLGAMAVSAITIFLLGRDLTFFSDEFAWLTFGDDFAPGTLLAPYNSHLIAIPVTLYELLPRVFGADYLAFRLLGIVGVLGVASAFFVLARRRLGGPQALGPTLVLLFFGATAETVLTPLGIPFNFSIAFGLASFVAVERNTRAGDWLAVALLAASILSHTFGTIFGVGMLVYLLAARAPWARLLVAGVPLALWAGWYVWSQRFDQGIADPSNLLGSPAFVVESAATSLAAIVGVNRSVDNFTATAVTIVFVPLAIAGTVLLVRFVRRNGATPWVWAYAATALVFWFGISLAASETRQPTTPRYLYFGAIMILLLAAEVARGRRLAGRRLQVAAGVVVICVAFNIVRMGFGAADLTRSSTEVRAQLAALELAGSSVDPNFKPIDAGPLGTDGIVAPAGDLADFISVHGRLGMSPGELARQSEALREGADAVLVRSQNLIALPFGALAARETVRCDEFGAGGGAAAFELEPGLSVVRVLGDVAEPLTLGRFADSPTTVAGELTPGEPSGIFVPDDSSPRPWLAAVPAPVEVCALRDGDGGGAVDPTS